MRMKRYLLSSVKAFDFLQNKHNNVLSCTFVFIATLDLFQVFGVLWDWYKECRYVRDISSGNQKKPGNKERRFPLQV